MRCRCALALARSALGAMRVYVRPERGRGSVLVVVNRYLAAGFSTLLTLMDK